ncbi:hypothetical protein J3R83DRAFT_2361 [Lanmaoa asiatica]|nr:hypothetical protein J3R83DRAFT_2361 [Lanmaoa asiatica]
MTFLKSALSHLSRKSTPIVATNMSLDSWCHQLRTQPTRFVKKIEMCTALAAGRDAWGTLVGKTHYHTLIRVFLITAPGGPGASEDVLLVERVLSTGGSYHSVTPIAESFSAGGTLFHPDILDRICIVSEGPSTALAHHLEAERTLAFGDGSSEHHLTLAQFAQILDFVSRTTMLICAGGDCKFQSRSFSFTCLAALAPRLPPPTSTRRAGEVVGMNAQYGEEMVDDSVFELGAEAFLGQVPWLVKDSVSAQAVSILFRRSDDVRMLRLLAQLRLIGALKDEPRGRAKARLYH